MKIPREHPDHPPGKGWIGQSCSYLLKYTVCNRRREESGHRHGMGPAAAPGRRRGKPMVRRKSTGKGTVWLVVFLASAWPPPARRRPAGWTTPGAGEAAGGREDRLPSVRLPGPVREAGGIRRRHRPYLAKALFEDEGRLETVPVTTGSRIPFLYSDWIDMIVATMTSRRSGGRCSNSRTRTSSPPPCSSSPSAAPSAGSRTSPGRRLPSSRGRSRRRTSRWWPPGRSGRLQEHG